MKSYLGSLTEVRLGRPAGDKTTLEVSGSVVFVPFADAALRFFGGMMVRVEKQEILGRVV